MIDLVAGEWLKLRTTWLLFSMIPAAVALSSAAVAGSVLVTHGRDGVALESAEGIQRVLSVTGTGAILVLVLGIVVSAGEYRHGTAADTFLTTGRRHLVVGAKLLVGAAVGLLAGVLISGAAIVVAAIVYRAKDETFPAGDGDVWLTLAGTLVHCTLFALIGVALGTLVRNQVAAVAGALAWLAVIEHTLVNLVSDIGRWLPAAAGQAIVRAPIDGLLAPAAGAALLAVYAAAIGAVGVRSVTAGDV